MAIKLSGVSGERLRVDGEPDDQTQDFVMINHPVFAFPNPTEYVRFFRLRKRLGLTLAKVVLGLTRSRIAHIAKQIQGNPIDGLLTSTYFSMSPYRLGTRAIKFSVRPRPANWSGNGTNGAGSRSETFLFDGLADHLAQQEASFDFLVQFQEDRARMPVEDATVEWDSPFHPVGVLHIPRQDLRSPESLAFRASCEDLSFNPWHALRDHEPLGGLNRLRRAVYHESATLRVHRNREGAARSG